MRYWELAPLPVHAEHQRADLTGDLSHSRNHLNFSTQAVFAGNVTVAHSVQPGYVPSWWMGIKNVGSKKGRNMYTSVRNWPALQLQQHRTQKSCITLHKIAASIPSFLCLIAFSVLCWTQKKKRFLLFVSTLSGLLGQISGTPERQERTDSRSLCPSRSPVHSRYGYMTTERNNLASQRTCRWPKQVTNSIVAHAPMTGGMKNCCFQRLIAVTRFDQYISSP